MTGDAGRHNKVDRLLEAAEQAEAAQQARLRKVLADACRLRDLGPGSMHSEDEARHMADGVLDLLIETLEALAPEVPPTTGAGS